MTCTKNYECQLGHCYTSLVHVAAPHYCNVTYILLMCNFSSTRKTLFIMYFIILTYLVRIINTNNYLEPKLTFRPYSFYPDLIKKVYLIKKNYLTFSWKQGKQCFQRWNRCVRFKVVKFDSLGLETCWTTFVSMSMLKPNCL